MSGYVEAGYTVVGVSLAAYATWMLRRSRSLEKNVGPVRGRAGSHDDAEPDGWR